eukprot:gene3386-5931_t
MNVFSSQNSNEMNLLDFDTELKFGKLAIDVDTYGTKITLGAISNKIPSNLNSSQISKITRLSVANKLYCPLFSNEFFQTIESDFWDYYTLFFELYTTNTDDIKLFCKYYKNLNIFSDKRFEIKNLDCKTRLLEDTNQKENESQALKSMEMRSTIKDNFQELRFDKKREYYTPITFIITKSPPKFSHLHKIYQVNDLIVLKSENVFELIEYFSITNIQFFKESIKIEVIEVVTNQVENTHLLKFRKNIY